MDIFVGTHDYYPRFDMAELVMKIWDEEIIKTVAFIWDVDYTLINYREHHIFSNTVVFTVEEYVICHAEVFDLLMLAMIGKERNGR